MSAFQPLGSLAAFSGFTSPAPWGPDASWQATFGSGQLVIDDLVAGLRAHPRKVEERWPAKAEPYPVVLGCSPWLTEMAVVRALSDMAGCVVVDKRNASYRAVRALAESGQGLWQMLLGQRNGAREISKEIRL